MGLRRHHTDEADHAALQPHCQTFTNATFSRGEVRFSLTTFSGGTVSSGSATFSGGTGQLSARFPRRPLNFPNASFSGAKASFSNATFAGGQVDFTGRVTGDIHRPSTGLAQHIPQGWSPTPGQARSRRRTARPT